MYLANKHNNANSKPYIQYNLVTSLGLIYTIFTGTYFKYVIKALLHTSIIEKKETLSTLYIN